MSPAESVTWSEDMCTCGHAVSRHRDSEGRCEVCTNDAAWARSRERPRICTRYQWNGDERTRIW